MPHEPVLQSALEAIPRVIDLIGRLVECESPSDSPADVNRFVDLLIDEASDCATATRLPGKGVGDHLLLDFGLTGREAKRALALGHSDTVWPIGTLTSMPFRQDEKRLWGPGVLDMKTGLALLIFAVRTVRKLRMPVNRPLALLVVSDEEIGSESSRLITELEARASSHVLVLEPGTGPTGKLKTARKGVGHYRITITGKAAHAGVDFEQGASAIVEAATVVRHCSGLTNLGLGTTVNPGVIRGGTRSNVIAAEATLEVDVRTVTPAEAARIDAAIKAIRPIDLRCAIHVSGGLNRPPMERTKAIADLFARAQNLASDLGFAIEESSTGGGSDGNFTAALGVPTLDGLGAVGEGAHAANESVLISHLPQRLALLVALIATL